MGYVCSIKLLTFRTLSIVLFFIYLKQRFGDESASVLRQKPSQLGPVVIASPYQDDGYCPKSQ
jgi:hypothetical protein